MYAGAARARRPCRVSAEIRPREPSPARSSPGAGPAHGPCRACEKSHRASQIIPVYPLTEDVQPGDVFVVPMPIARQAELYEEMGLDVGALVQAMLGNPAVGRVECVPDDAAGTTYTVTPHRDFE